MESAQLIIDARPYMLTGRGKYKKGSIIANSSKKIDINEVQNRDLAYIENNSSNPLENLTVIISYDDDKSDILNYYYFKVENLNPNKRIYLTKGTNFDKGIENIDTQFNTKNNETVQVSYDFKNYKESIPGVYTELNDLPKKKTIYYDSINNIRSLKKLSGNNAQIKNIEILKDTNLNTRIAHPVDEKHLYWKEYLLNNYQ